MFKGTSILVLAIALGYTWLAQAKDVYYDLPITQLKLVEGRLPDQSNNPNYRNWQTLRGMEPYVAVEGPGEAYPPSMPMEYWINARVPEGKEIKGRLVLFRADASGMDLLRFVFPASAAKPRPRSRFIAPNWPITIACWPATSPAGPGSGIRPDWPGWR